MNYQEKLAIIIEILDENPSISAWESLMDIVMESNEEEQSALVAAVLKNSSLKKWNAKYRVCPEGSWEEIHRGDIVPIWWPLIQHLDYITYEGDIGPVHLLKSIYSLNILDGYVSAPDNLKELNQLAYLRFVDNEISFSCEEISALTNLKELSLFVIHLGSIAFVRPLKHLEILDLSFCDAITDISPISELKMLQKIRLQGCTSITDLSPLEELPLLLELDLRGCAVSIDRSRMRADKKLKIIQ